MSDTPAKINPREIVLGQLRNPLKLRLTLCVAILAAWYLLFFSPLGGQMAVTTARTDKECQRIATAREIEQLRKSLNPYRDRVAAKSDPNELIQQVMDHIRPTAFRLIDLKPEKPKDLGPFEAIGLRLVFEGSFAELDAFLTWVQTDQRLMRIDSLKVEPHPRDQTKLAIQLTLLSLVEKEKPAASEKPGKS